jgi:hypothetical protein
MEGGGKKKQRVVLSGRRHCQYCMSPDIAAFEWGIVSPLSRTYPRGVILIFSSGTTAQSKVLQHHSPAALVRRSLSRCRVRSPPTQG